MTCKFHTLVRCQW